MDNTKMVLAVTAYYGSSTKKENEVDLFEQTLNKTIASALELKRNGVDVEIVIGMDGFQRYEDRKKVLLEEKNRIGELDDNLEKELQAIITKEAELEKTQELIHNAFEVMDAEDIKHTYIQAKEQMFAGGMRNAIFSEYKNADTDLLTFIDDDDYLIPENMEAVINSLRAFKESAEFDDNKKILGAISGAQKDSNCHQVQAVWGCIYSMKNFDLMPMPSEIKVEDRFFRFLNHDKTQLFSDYTTPMYYHSIENHSVDKETENIEFKNGTSNNFQDDALNINTGIKIRNNILHGNIYIGEVADKRIKNYLIQNNITLETLLEIAENHINEYYNINLKKYSTTDEFDDEYLSFLRSYYANIKEIDNYKRAIEPLLMSALNCENSIELPNIEDLIRLKNTNQLNEFKIKELLNEKLQEFNFDNMKTQNSNLVGESLLFDRLKNKKTLLQREMEDFKYVNSESYQMRLMELEETKVRINAELQKKLATPENERTEEQKSSIKHFKRRLKQTEKQEKELLDLNKGLDNPYLNPQFIDKEEPIVKHYTINRDGIKTDKFITSNTFDNGFANELEQPKEQNIEQTQFSEELFDKISQELDKLSPEILKEKLSDKIIDQLSGEISQKLLGELSLEVLETISEQVSEQLLKSLTKKELEVITK